MEKTAQARQATRLEYNAYGAFFFGENFIWALIGMLATFITDIGISAAVAAVVLLIPKVWDAVNDTIFGVLVDKIKLKSGQKYLPWMRLGTILIGVVTLFMFAAPSGMSDLAKAAWIIVAYIIFDTGYTMLDAPLFALPSALTSNIQERTSILSNGRFWAMVGGMAAGMVIPLVRPRAGWFVSAVIVTLISIASMLPLVLKAQERVRSGETESEGISFKDMWNYLKSNGQLFVVLLVMFIIGVTSVEAVISMQVARICFGNESFATLLMIIMMVPMLLFSKLVPVLTKRFDKVTVFIAGLGMSIVSGVLLCFVDPSNMPLVVVLMLFKGTGLISYQVISYLFVADAVEYGTYRTGTRASGISFSLQTFTAKLCGALVTSFSLAILSLIGFVSGEGAVQPEGVAENLWKVYTLIPAAGYIAAMILMLVFYKLRDRDVQTMSEYNNGEISKEEADAKLASKYGPAPAHKN